MAAPDAANPPSCALKPDAVDADAGLEAEAAEEDSEIAEDAVARQEEASETEEAEADSVTAEAGADPQEAVIDCDFCDIHYPATQKHSRCYHFSFNAVDPWSAAYNLHSRV